MSLSRTSSWLGPRLRVSFACAISHPKNGLRCEVADRIGGHCAVQGVPSQLPWTFVFTIKLADVPSHAEENTLYLAVRYSVAGREVWDNNSGRNYHVQIVREKVSKANKETVVEKPQGSSHADNIVDLRHQLKQAGIQAWPLIRDS